MGRGFFRDATLVVFDDGAAHDVARAQRRACFVDLVLAVAVGHQLVERKPALGVQAQIHREVALGNGRAVAAPVTPLVKHELYMTAPVPVSTAQPTMQLTSVGVSCAIPTTCSAAATTCSLHVCTFE